MSTGGLMASTLPDEDFKDNGIPVDLDDDVEITFTESDESSIPPDGKPPLRGQNEGAADQYGGDDDLNDIADPVIRERIMHERRLRSESERKFLEQQEQADYALLNERKEKLQVQADAFRLSLDGIDVRIRTTREALKMAKMDGDASAEIDLQAQMQELTQMRDGIVHNMRSLPTQEQLDEAFARHIRGRREQFASRAPTSSSNGEPQPKNSKAAAWKSNNASWMSDPQRVAEKAALVAIDQQLVKEGRNPNSDEYFVELSRRMAKSFPNLGVRDASGRSFGAGQSPAPRSNSAPVAAARSSLPPSPHSPSNRPRVEVGREDRALLLKLGIDISDKDKVQRFVKERYKRLRSEQRGA